MGNSYIKGPAGQVPWAASPITAGPLGTNNDAGDPSTPAWFVGNNAGPVGHGDYADPNGKMCKLRPTRNYIDEYVKNGIAKRRREFETVKRELEETLRIREAYIDRGLLQQAKIAGWSSIEFQAKVIEKLFGSPKEGQAPNSFSPMGTNPENCRISENWKLEDYRRHGLPDVVYWADRAHETVHSANCKRLPSMQYNADMSFPEKLSKDEEKAYTAKIEVLERWLRENSTQK